MTPAPVFRSALSRFASGVTVVTLAGSKANVGITISSFASLSLDPPLILFALDKNARMHPRMKKGLRFAVHILAEDQKKLAEFYAGRIAHKIRKKDYRMADSLPLLNGALAILHCHVKALQPGGDHTIVIGAVEKIDVAENKKKPLLHAQRAYHRLGRKL